MNITVTPLDEATRQRIIKRMVKEHQFSEELANAIFDETLVFMHASINNPGIGPSELVDIGWHTFILYTMEYTAYCHRAFGRYLHHNPTDREGEVGAPLSETIDFFRANGIKFDAELWGMGAECQKCDPRCGGTNCGRDPRVIEAKSGCVGHGGPNCGTQIDPRTPCEVVMAGCKGSCNGGVPGGGNCTGCRSCGSV